MNLLTEKEQETHKRRHFWLVHTRNLCRLSLTQFPFANRGDDLLCQLALSQRLFRIGNTEVSKCVNLSHMQLILTALDASLALAWRRFCGDLECVEVHLKELYAVGRSGGGMLARNWLAKAALYSSSSAATRSGFSERTIKPAW